MPECGVMLRPRSVLCSLHTAEASHGHRGGGALLMPLSFGLPQWRVSDLQTLGDGAQQTGSPVIADAIAPIGRLVVLETLRVHLPNKEGWWGAAASGGARASAGVAHERRGRISWYSVPQCAQCVPHQLGSSQRLDGFEPRGSHPHVAVTVCGK